MAKVKISELPFCASPLATGLIPFSQCGVTYATNICSVGTPSVIVAGAGTNSTIRCGVNNSASAAYSFAGGGLCNTATGCNSFVGGGFKNCATCGTGGACGSFVGAGQCNIASGLFSSIVGGECNNACGSDSFIGGGCGNIACNTYSSVLGGGGNIASGTYSGASGCGLNASSNCTFYVNNMCVCGTLSKVSGSFKIPHPDPIKAEAGKFLKHSFVESPTAGDNIYRFNVTTSNCSASIELPDYYNLLNGNDQVYVNAKSHLGYGFGIINSDQTKVEITTNTDGVYNVLIIGTRKDKLALDSWNGTEVEANEEKKQ